MKIALIGYMGSGKSFLMSELESLLPLKAIDLDEYLENHFLQQKIADFISAQGELKFRKAEKKALEEISKLDNIILATGGGTPCYYNNLDLLNEHFSTFFLDVPIAILAERLKSEKNHRPLISHVDDENLNEFIAKHLFERRIFYTQAAYTLKHPDISAQKIITLIDKYDEHSSCH